MNMYQALHSRHNIDRLYVLVKRGRGLASIEVYANALVKGFEEYNKNDKRNTYYNNQ